MYMEIVSYTNDMGGAYYIQINVVEDDTVIKILTKWRTSCTATNNKCKDDEMNQEKESCYY